MSDAWLQRLVGDWTWESRPVPDDPAEHRRGTARGRRHGVWILFDMDEEAHFAFAHNPRTGRIVGQFIHRDQPGLWVYDGAFDAEGRLHLRSRGPGLDDPAQTVDYDDVFVFTPDDELVATGRVTGPDGAWRDFTTAVFRRREPGA